MDKGYEMFVPWSGGNAITNENLRINHSYKQKQFYLKKSYTPYFAVVNEDCTLKFFIDTVLKQGYEDALVYISKKFVYDNDYEEIKQLFANLKSYKYLINVSFDKETKCKVKSVLLTDREFKVQNIVRAYLIYEPDKFSKWKIFMLKKE